MFYSKRGREERRPEVRTGNVREQEQEQDRLGETSETNCECPRLGLTRVDHTEIKGESWRLERSSFLIQQGMSCLNTREPVPKQASKVEVKEIRRKWHGE